MELISLCVRDTLGLTPADNKSLKALGKVIGRHKIELPKKVNERCRYRSQLLFRTVPV